MATYTANGPSGEQERNGWLSYINGGGYTEAQEKALAEKLLEEQAAELNKRLPEGCTWYPESSQLMYQVDADDPEPDTEGYNLDELMREAVEAVQERFEVIEAPVMVRLEAEAMDRLLQPLHEAAKDKRAWFEVESGTFRKKSVSAVKVGDLVLVEADTDHGLRIVEWSDSNTLFLRSANTPETSPPTLTRVTGKVLTGMSAEDEGDPTKDETCISTVDGKVFVLTYSSVAVPV